MVEEEANGVTHIYLAGWWGDAKERNWSWGEGFTWGKRKLESSVLWEIKICSTMK